MYKEKGSKFLSFTYRVSGEQEISRYLETLKKQYHDARHHCFAWRLGPDLVRFRMNDDGEPSGSAGKPIYGQIIKRELTDILVVVVRYFGGTKLGVGGLINAYRSAASDALDHSSLIECQVYDRLKLEFEYPQMNRIMKIIKDLDLESSDQKFDLECSLILHPWKRRTELVVDTFSKIPACKISRLEE